MASARGVQSGIGGDERAATRDLLLRWRTRDAIAKAVAGMAEERPCWAVAVRAQIDALDEVAIRAQRANYLQIVLPIERAAEDLEFAVSHEYAVAAPLVRSSCARLSAALDRQEQVRR